MKKYEIGEYFLAKLFSVVGKLKKKACFFEAKFIWVGAGSRLWNYNVLR